MVTAARSPLWPDSRSCVIVSAPEAGLRGPEGGSARGCSVKTPVWAGASQVGPGPRPGSDGEAERPVPVPVTMAVFHDEVEIEDFQYDEDSETYFYPCPCGDNFCITKEDLENGEDVATCPSCSLIIKVIYDKKQNQTRVSTSAAVRRDCGLKAGDRALRLLSGIPGLSPLGASGSPQYVNPKHLYTLPDVPKDTSNTSFPPPIETPVLEQEGCFQRLRTWSLMLTVDPCQSPLSVGFSRQEYWSELPCPPPEGLPDPGIKSTSLTSPALAGSVHVWRDSPSPFHQQRTS